MFRVENASNEQVAVLALAVAEGRIRPTLHIILEPTWVHNIYEYYVCIT